VGPDRLPAAGRRESVVMESGNGPTRQLQPDADPEADQEEALLERLEGTAPGPGEADLGMQELEALLFVAERPLHRREIARLAGVDRDTVDQRLGDLEVVLAGRGLRLLSVGDEVELATAPDAGPLIARYLGGDGIARPSPASLETLAIVAYRQPVTRAVIERIRGVDSEYILRSLLHRRLVVEQGRADTPGRPILYATSFAFLERFGLASLDDLPSLDAEVAARLVDAEMDAAQGAAGQEPGTPIGVGVGAGVADGGDHPDPA
jgi:segregation and condensation protein B